MGGAIGRLLGTGARAEVYEWDDHVIKLYRAPDGKAAAFREAAIQAAVEELGLPVPAVWSVQQVNGRWGVVFDRVTGTRFIERMRDNPGKIPLYLEQLARLHLRIHSHLAAQFAGLKPRLASNIAAADLIDQEQKTILLKRLAEMPDGDRLCHGDFHPLNILRDAAQPVVIDWPDARRGDPAADVCRSYLLMRLYADEFAEPYLDAYHRASSLPREAIIRWLPYIAAARLSENVGDETDRLLAILRPARP